MGANYGAPGGGYVDADYYDVHAAWFVTKSLTMVAAYARTGAKANPSLPMSTSNPAGFGNGLVLSGQYAF